MGLTLRTLAVLLFYLLHFRSDGKEICRQRPVDVLFLVDGSRSVRPKNFVLVKEYMKAFADLFDNLGPPNSQIGVIQFASRVREEIALNQFFDKTELKQAIDNIKYMEMGTMTGEALKYLVNVALQPSHGSRLSGGVHTIAIIITDGRSQDYSRGTVTLWQREAKSRGVEIYAIGVGRKANERELNELASIPKAQHVYEVESFDAIESLDVRIFGQEICDEDECESGAHQCEQICTNTEGSYECSCREGFNLQEDRRSCLMPIAAPVPDNLRFTQITHTSSQVSWDIGAVSDDVVDHYVLIYVRTDGIGNDVVRKIYGNKTTALVDLEPNTEYRVSISSTTEDDFSVPVDGTFTTLRLGRTKLTLSNATLTTLTATWLPAGGDGLTGYELLYQLSEPESINGQEPIPMVTTRRFGPDILHTELTELEPETLYYVRIMPLHGELVGGSASDEARTDVLRPPFVKVINTTLSMLTASWSILKANYPIDTWSVSIFPSTDERNALQTKEIEGGVTETIFHQLRPSTQYRVEVAANVGRFTTSKGTAVKKTKILKKPQVSASNVTQTSLNAQWKEINVMADSWAVKIYPPTDRTQSQVKSTGRGQRSATFINLLPSTMYRIEVIGRVIEDGTTFNSQTGRHKVKTRALTGPPLELVNATFSTLTGTWRDINIPVDRWMVRIFIDGSDAALQEYDVDGTQHSQVFNELAADTTYRVEVVGQVTQGAITLDSPIGAAQGTTMSELSFDAPYVTCDNLDTPSRLRVEWPESDENINTWMVVIGATDNEELTNHKVDGRQFSLDLTNLRPGTSYIVEVFGQIVEGSSVFNTQSGITSCETEPLTAPPVEVTATTYLSLAIQWDDINMPVDTWTINLLNAEKEVLETIDAEGSDHELLFSGLKQGTYYDVQVIGHVRRENTTHDSPIGATSGTTKSFISVAGPQVECMDPGLTSTRALWSDVSIPVTSWTIRYYPEGQEQLRKDIDDIPEAEREKTIVQLRPATSYVIEIVGNVREDAITFQTQQGVATCTTQSITAPVVVVVDPTFHSLTARWGEINMDVDTWLVVLSNDETGYFQEQEIPRGVNQFTFTGLEQDTPYDVEVVGKLRADNLVSPPGRSVGATSELDSPYVECFLQSMVSLGVSWTDASTDMDSWTIEAYVGENGLKTIFRADGNKSEVNIGDLIPDTKYTIKLEGSVTENGKSYTTPTEYIECATDALPIPDVIVNATTTSTLHAQWDDHVDFPIETWTIAINRRYGKEIFKTTVDGGESQFTFEDLLPQTPYTIRVKGNYRGKESSPGTAYERTDRLTAPVVEITKPTLSTLTVGWSDINMDMTSWIISLKEKETEIDVASWTASGSTRSRLFGSLRPNTEYEASVIGKLAARNTTRYSPKGQALGTTDAIDAPHITCSNTTATSVVVTWTTNEDTPVSSWTVRIAETGTGNYAQEVQFYGHEFRHVFVGMRPTTTYDVEVTSHFVENGTTFSSSSMRDSCTTRPTPPQNIHTTERGVTHLVASFDPPISLADDYEAICIPIGDPESQVRGEVAASEFTVHCNDLNPATEYKIIVKAIFKGLPSEPIRTMNTTLVPPPTGLTLSEPTTHSMLATWQAPDVDNVDRYYVSYNSSDDDVELRIVQGSQTSLGLTDLEPNTLYHVRVQAEVNAERSCPDEAAESTLPEIIQLQIDDVGYTSINVSWNASNVPHVKSYCLEYEESSNDGVETELSLPPDVLSHTLSELRTATEYKISINARYRKTKSEETEIFATTLALPPIGPMTFSNVTESSFVAHWIPPKGAPQPTSYTVTYYTEEEEPKTVKNVRDTKLLIEELTSLTLYDVTVSACYDDELISHPIRGKETTLDLSACSCSTYLKSQRQMQSMLMQMVEQINVLNEKIDRLTSRKNVPEGNEMTEDE